jgi:hypothetical protein
MALTREEMTMMVEVMKEAGLVQKNDPASLTLGGQQMHGVMQSDAAKYGLFSKPGVRPQRLSALVRPPSEIFRNIGLERSEYINELLEIMTGQQAATGTNATGWCGDPPGVGLLKKANQNYVFGSYFVKSDLNAIPDIGQLRNRADVPAEIVNAGPTANPLIPDLMYRMADTRSQLQSDLYRVGVQAERALDIVMILGDTSLASNATRHGFVKEFKGLDAQIKTGYTDSDLGVAVPALDSIVISYNAAVDGTDANSENIIAVVHDLVYAARSRAERTGVTGAQWAFVMREELFRSIASAWACSYNVYKCSVSGAGINQMATDTRRFLDEMMTGRYLLVDGVEYPVLYSEGIPQDSLGANQFKSDLYFVPFTSDQMDLLRMEYFPMDNQYLKEFTEFAGADDITTMNNGLWIAGVRHNGFCREYLFGMKLRLILEAPWLAGRVDDIRYTFRAQIRNAQTADSWFYRNGGVTYQPT